MNSSEIQGLIAQAISAHRSGRLDEADGIYGKVLKVDPINGDANHNRGVLKASRKQFPAAEKLFRLAVKSEKAKEQYYISYINLLLKIKKNKKAQTILSESFKLGFSSPQLHQLKERISRLKQDRQNPQNTLKSSRNTKRAPSRKEIEQIAEAVNNENRAQSQSLARRMIKKYPDHPLGWKVRGVNNEVAGKLQEATIDAETVIKLDPSDDEGHRNLAILYKRTCRLQEAEKHTLKAIQLNPASTDHKLLLASIVEKLQDPNRAVEIFENLIKKDPVNSQALNEYGNFLFRIGSTNNAVIQYKKAAELMPEDSDILTNLSKSLHAIGDYNSAKRALVKAIELDPNNDTAHYTLGQFYYQEENFRSAVPHLKRSNQFLSKTYLLRCFLETGAQREFKTLLDEINRTSNINAMLGSIVSRAEMKFNITLHNPFAEDMYKYVYKNDLSALCDFKPLFGSLASNILKAKNISRKSQSLLSQGEQTAGNIFNLGGALVRDAENIIRRAVEAYRVEHSKEVDGFITNWPASYKLHGWLINMTKGGSIAPHIHELGWLGGAVYISVPKKAGTNEGNFVVCKDSDKYLDNSKQIIDVNSGDIVLFPASLMHYTIPFTSEKPRIVLAFDLIPN